MIGKRGLAITLIWLRSFVKTILSFFMSNRGIPKTILEIYSSNSIIDRAYLNIRWRLCPFQKIEALIPQEGLIIDIGCGYGLLSNLIALKSHKRNVVGIDSSETRILTAQKTVKDRKNIKFLKQDITAFNFPSCDAIVMSDVLHHLPIEIKDILIKNIYNNLKNNGVLIIQDVDTSPYWKFWLTYLSDFLQHSKEKLFYQPAKEIEDNIKRIGFKVDTIEAHKGYPVADIIFLCKK